MVIQHILHYLIEHPDAKDTVSGILRWWLPANPRGWEEQDVQQALDVLVVKAWVTRRQLISSEVLYGLSPSKIQEIQDFLQET